jgi:hypothetical protein
MGNDVLFNGGGTAGTRIGATTDAYRVAERRRAVRALAGNHAHDAADLALLLDALGLAAEEGLAG